MFILIVITLSLNLGYLKATSWPGWPSDLKPLEPATNTWRRAVASCRAVKSLQFVFCKYKANTWTETREEYETLWHTNTQASIIRNISSACNVNGYLLSYFLCAPCHPFFTGECKEHLCPLVTAQRPRPFAPHRHWHHPPLSSRQHFGLALNWWSSYLTHVMAMYRVSQKKGTNRKKS